jgi:hypothetical protein
MGLLVFLLSSYFVSASSIACRINLVNMGTTQQPPISERLRRKVEIPPEGDGYSIA